MFTRRKEELQILQKSLESLENSQKNTELMVSTFCNMMESQNEKKVTGNQQEVTDEERRRAAYALNLCTVSVSQIIDYDDVNILEQEYETILNNLNLENMPKDEALLNILKQLLDTVTFFRIQEGDKKFIEKEYQQKMKNAIWSAVPNFGIIATGGKNVNPFNVALALASQIGIGYMNYRKTKAENSLEKEQKEWQLQRSAIEQFNGLRRELFDTSWRLADKYEFPDEYRLTERQITQYNDILMDPNNLRKYERLESVQEYFTAYPPFWYYFGHAANEIAQQALRQGETSIYDRYKEFAINHFETYMQTNRYALLREDQITSSCALEYIDLLDDKNDKEKIKKLLDCAERMSGRECDVLQLCAMAYLRIGEYNQGITLLKYLVNESYNTVTNAQLLSSIYVSGYCLSGKRSKLDVDYKLLTKKVDANWLFPFPENSDASLDELTRDFVEKQRNILLQRYAYVLQNYILKYTIQFNKCIPQPYEDKIYSDIFYSDQEEYRAERMNQYQIIFSNENLRENYISRMAVSNFALSYVETLNKMVNEIEYIIPEPKNDNMWDLAECIEKKLLQKKEDLNRLQEKLDGTFTFVGFESLLKNLTFQYFTEDFFKNVVSILKKHIFMLQDMSEFSKEETILREFCINQEIAEFEISLSKKGEMQDVDIEKAYISSELLGEEAARKSKVRKVARQISKIISGYQEQLIWAEKDVDLITKFDVGKDDFKGYFKKKKYAKDLIENIVAVIGDKFPGRDLVFTTEGIIFDRRIFGSEKNPGIVKYTNVYKEKKEIKIGEDFYKSKSVNKDALYDLIQELSEVVTTNEVENKQGGQRFLQNGTYQQIEEKTSNV